MALKMALKLQNICVAVANKSKNGGGEEGIFTSLKCQISNLLEYAVVLQKARRR